MNALEKALFETLGDAASVTGKLADGADGIYADEAPQGAAFPHIVFQRIAGTPRYSLPQREWEEFVYRVKAVTADDSSKGAQAIAEAVDAVLSDGEFTISGQSLMYSRKLADNPALVETEESTRYNTRGADFEIWVGPAA